MVAGFQNHEKRPNLIRSIADLADRLNWSNTVLKLSPNILSPWNHWALKFHFSYANLIPGQSTLKIPGMSAVSHGWRLEQCCCLNFWRAMKFQP
jgi:hypothetical protein